MKTLVLIGASGLIGSHVIKLALKQSSIEQIFVVTRNSSIIKDSIQHPKIRRISFDFKDWSSLAIQIKSFAGTKNLVFCSCLGTTLQKAKSKEAFRLVDHDYVNEFAKIAEDSKAGRFILVSSIGADSESKFFYNQVKGEAEESVRKSFHGPLKILRPSLLLGDRQEFRLAERLSILFAPLYSPFLIGHLKKYRPIKAQSVASIIIKLIIQDLFPEILIIENELIHEQSRLK